MALFRRFASLGVSSVLLCSVFAACESSSDSPPQTSFDASSPALDATTAKDAPSAQDATPDAVADAATEAAAPVFADVAKDFATVTNPNGAWTYGYTVNDPVGAAASALVVYSTVNSDNPQAKGWYDPTNVSLGAPAAFRNDTGATLSTGVLDGEFAMHPGAKNEYAVVRWTAPAAGTYSVTVQFKTGDTGDTNGLLLQNGVAIVTDESTSAETLHSLDVTLAAGDRLEAAVGSKGDYLFDTTPVHLTIRSAGADP